jgi:hypothetical protein
VVISSSTDYINWSPMSTNVLQSGSLFWLDPSTIYPPTGFYKAQLLP